MGTHRECPCAHLSFSLSDKPSHSLLQHLHTVLCPCNCGKKHWWPRCPSQEHPKGFRTGCLGWMWLKRSALDCSRSDLRGALSPVGNPGTGTCTLGSKGTLQPPLAAQVLLEGPDNSNVQLQELIPASSSSWKLLQGQSWHRASHWQCWSGVTTLAPLRDCACLKPLSLTHTLTTHCNNSAITQMGGWKRLILEVFFHLFSNHCKFAIADMGRERGSLGQNICKHSQCLQTQ